MRLEAAVAAAKLGGNVPPVAAAMRFGGDVVAARAHVDQQRGEGATGAELRGLAQEREARVAVQVLDGRGAGYWRITTLAARRLDRFQVRGLVSEVDLGGSRAAEALVRPVIGVVVKRAGDVALEILGRQQIRRRPQSQQRVLDGTQEALDAGVGAVVVGGAEAQADAAGGNAVAERVAVKAPSLSTTR